MDDAQIIEKILSGCSLRTFMTPDAGIPQNAPLHDESFELPHIVINNNFFWGMTPDNMIIPPDFFDAAAFFYSNYHNMFGTFFPQTARSSEDHRILLKISSKKRYMEHSWVLGEASELIWDSEGDNSLDNLRDSIHESKKLHVAFLDDEEVWNIHNVILPQMNRNSNAFLLMTHYIAYPYLFRNSMDFDGVINAHNGHIDNLLKDPKEYLEGFANVETPVFFSFNHIYSDGTYKSFYDLARGNTVNRYRHLKVFAEK